jgi:hypothetical protein
VQEYTPTLEYEDEEVEELCGVIKEIHEDGRGETNTIIIRDWNTVVGDKSYQHAVRPHGLGRRNQ